MRSPRRPHLASLFAAAALAACSAPDAIAPGIVVDRPLRSTGGSIVVTNLDPSGTGSLRDAIDAATGGETITFEPSLAGRTINLNGGLTISKAITIEGPANGGIALSTGQPARPFTVGATGDLTVRNVTINGGVGFPNGGAIYNDGGKVTLDHVLIRNGGAIESGGAIYSEGNSASLHIVNSTITGAGAGSGFGGGIYVGGGTLVLDQSTVAFNSSEKDGGGLVVSTLSVATVRNSIISNNTVSTPSSASVLNCINFGSLTLEGRNISDVASCAPTSGSWTVGDPLLAPLFGNGGPTQTLALQVGSSAINTALNCTVTTDQRYVARPQGGACDVGAYEFDKFETFVPAIDPNVVVNATTGVAIVSGSASCSVPGSYTLAVSLSQVQKNRRTTVTARASTTTTVNCSATGIWSAILKPASGGFVAGNGTASANTSFLPNNFAPATVTTPVTMYWSRR